MAGDAAREIEKRVRAAGTSFYWAMRSLDPEKRRAIFAVYAFCREVDDIADSEDSPAVKTKLLNKWRDRIAALFKSNPTEVITEELLIANAMFGLEKDAYLAIIEGMEMDATGPIQAPSRAEFDLYISRVASAVGLLCIRIFGEAGNQGEVTAEHLGRALQITNILRDLREDADWDRLYLPRDLLVKHGIKSTDPEEVLKNQNLDALCRELAEMAEQEFHLANQAFKKCDQTRVKPALIMRDAYQRTLKRLIRRGWTPEAVKKPRTGLQKFSSKVAKLLIALKYSVR
ncbi:MAG: presqualene diphosphate synthase HpnD [Alphaproteobacteria bacterium]